MNGTDIGSEPGSIQVTAPEALAPDDQQQQDEQPSPSVMVDAPVVQGQPLGWMVRFHEGTQEAEMRAASEERGGSFVFAFRSLPIAYILASEQNVERMRGDPRFVHIEREEPIEYYDAQSRAALRVPQVTDVLTGLKDAAGNPIDGRGIGVAVVDTGIDALHPDLPYAPVTPGGVVVANYKVAGLAFVPLADTDTSAGHGTHIAAIVAGQGSGSASARGVATGARLYGLGIGDATTNLWAAEALDWVVQNHATVNPPIRIVTNSWGSGTAYDPNAAITQFVNALVDRDVTVVFAAGNNAGSGAAAQTSSQCQIPRAGVICVAAYDDLDTGTRDGQIAGYSSRGASAQQSTWPDIAAPGTKIYSARPPAGAITGMGLDLNYVNLQGTSQAAPHVAGIVALMLQKHPEWSPATLEAKLKCTAYKFEDGASYTSVTAPSSVCAGPTSSYDKGFGLADAYSAVSAT